jgi:beta-1,4-mannosyl-glycoprotein beta-1,4-N-acetylglucosaminyltransferase
MIYYTFQFWDELDLLEVQLNENYDFVDKFVLTESTISWTGKRKPLYYENNKKRFEKFSDKIEHIIINDLESITDFPADAVMSNFGEHHSKIFWAREHYARRKFFSKIKLNDEDIIFITDADMVINMKKALENFENDKINIYQMQEHFYYYNNYGGKNYSPKSFKFGNFKEIVNGWNTLYPDRIFNFDKKKYKYINDCAWHFSWMGGLEHSLLKLEYTSHTENNNNDYRSRLIDLYENKRFTLSKIEDLNLPTYIINNMHIYNKYFTY